MNFLIVEDNPKTAEILKRFLQADGINIFLAQDAYDAHLLVLSNHIDKTLTDLNLPYEDGFELARSLHKDTKLMEVLVYSSKQIQPEEIERVRRYGVDVCPETDPERIIRYAKSLWFI